MYGLVDSWTWKNKFQFLRNNPDLINPTGNLTISSQQSHQENSSELTQKEQHFFHSNN